MKKEIIIVMDYMNSFHAHHKKNSLDMDFLLSEFKKNFSSVTVMDYKQLHENHLNIQDKVIVYTSIERAREYKNSIKDIMYLLSKRNYLVPSYDVLMCHDNKIFQEYLKKYLNFSSINCKIFNNFLEFRDEKKIKYPAVLKFKSGSGSVNVVKVNDFLEVYKKSLPQITYNTNMNFKNKKLRTKYKVKVINFMLKFFPAKISYDYFKKKYNTIQTNDCSFVLQEFKPGFSHDFKVLVYDDIIFPIKRMVRKNDFRASGSGDFASTKLSDEVLEQVYQMHKLLNMPSSSFDILVDKDEKVYYIEYQGIHFGPSTINIADNYYKKEKNEFKEYQNDKNIEEMFCYAYINYIKNIFR